MPNINPERVARFADFLKTLPNNSFGLNFYSFRLPDGTDIVADKMYPPLEHPGTIDFFFFVCAHQYGFWYGDEAGYLEPMYGYFDGKKVKGSELIWRAAMRALVADETALAPRKLARISLIDFTKLFSDDKGMILFPNLEERLILTHSYGNYFRNTPPPKVIIEAVNKESDALGKLISLTQHSIPGYNEDPIVKKNLLLAMTLANRPEKFLRVEKTDPAWLPIVDYHLMRVALRLGLVELTAEEAKKNVRRNWISRNDEMSIRGKVFFAVKDVIERSGKPMAFVDEAMWQGRRYCLETETPNCDKCQFNGVCAKRVKLFQPVFRTTAY